MVIDMCAMNDESIPTWRGQTEMTDLTGDFSAFYIGKYLLDTYWRRCPF